MTPMVEDQPLIKHRPEDFVVFESMALRFEHDDVGQYQYLRLQKRGFTTFEGIATIAEFAGIDRQEVTYAGLKDEDAVTDQYVCIPKSAAYPVDEFNTAHASRTTYLRLVPSGTASTPMRIGRLDGNSFRIIIRNLSETAASALADRRHNHVFLNYYDTQRFGVPDGPKTTHLVGANLVSGDATSALDLVKGSRTNESARAGLWTATPEEFFASLDPRVLSFYYSAYASHQWNEHLNRLAISAGEVRAVERAGMPYRFLCSREAVARFAASWPELEYGRYRVGDDGKIEESKSTRATVIQAQVSAGAATADEFHDGRYQCEITMFLPSGCYATMAITQLLHRTSTEQ